MIILGLGFLLTPDEQEEFTLRNSKNAERISPYLGGKEVNTNPAQSHTRYVVNFGELDAEGAQCWPDLWHHLETTVRPERAQKDVRKYPRMVNEWWKFWNARLELQQALSTLDLCVVCSRVSKHLIFTRQSTAQTFAESLYVFPLDTYTSLALLQSRSHEAWVRLLSSSMGRDNQLRYVATDCFETFPFPHPDPRAVIPSLEDIGERLYDARASYMVDTDQGLTQTYNLLKDPDCHDERIEELRRLHEEMDRAVLAAYHDSTGDDAWAAIDVPPYCAASSADPDLDAHAKALERFNDLVIDRLFVLNAQRAAEEAAAT